MSLMHDWTLLSIVYDWKSGQVALQLRRGGSEFVSVAAMGVIDLHVPQRKEWGPSVSVNEVRGPIAEPRGKQVLEIEMQSGDVIRIVASSFNFPEG